jgi:hypothetical protein
MDVHAGQGSFQSVSVPRIWLERMACGGMSCEEIAIDAFSRSDVDRDTLPLDKMAENVEFRLSDPPLGP